MKKALPLLCDKCRYAVQTLQDRFPYPETTRAAEREKWCGECKRREEIRARREARGR